MKQNDPRRTDALEPLIHALRDELQHYGEMLALLDQQQSSAIDRHADQMLQSTGAIQSHSSVLQAARKHREKCQRALACSLGVLESSTFVELFPQLPDSHRPLVQSLVEENNSLLTIVQQRARQNHLLLSRSVEVMQQFLGVLMPACGAPVYDERGERQTALPSTPLYEAMG